MTQETQAETLTACCNAFQLTLRGFELKHGSVRDVIVELLQQSDANGIGWSYKRIADRVRISVPGSKTTAKSVACYRVYARDLKHGITPRQRDNILAIQQRV